VVRLSRLHAGAVDIRLLAPSAPQRAVAIGTYVQVSCIMFARERPADRAFPAIGEPSALRAEQGLRLDHLHHSRSLGPGEAGDRYRPPTSSELNLSAG
jgi:hypothetical protein